MTAITDRISRAREQLAAKGVSASKVDYLVSVFGPEVAVSILDDLVTKAAKQASDQLTHYKDFPSAAILKARALDLRRLTAELEAGRKVTVSAEVTPEQLAAMAEQVGLDPASGFYNYLTRQYIAQLYDMLIAAGATFDPAVKATATAREGWWPKPTKPGKPAPFWPIHPTK